MTADAAKRPEKYTVWDWSIRLFHWLIVIVIPLLWWTAEEGLMDWHRRLGIVMLGLVIFRLVWGVIGSLTARFLPMLKQLAGLGPYISGLRAKQHRPVFGHNPMGVLSVFALIGTLVVQVGTGLFSVDVDGLESGPLAVLVSFELGRKFADIHEFNFCILSTFITIHVLAVLAYQFILKNNLVGAMISGRKSFTSSPASPESDIRVPVVPFMIAVLIAVAAIYAVLNAA